MQHNKWGIPICDRCDRLTNRIDMVRLQSKKGNTVYICNRCMQKLSRKNK